MAKQHASTEDFIIPRWPVPSGIRAVSTTRLGGVSSPPYSSFNLAAHVGDREAHVWANRRQLRCLLDLPSEPLWLHQVHGNRVVCADMLTHGPQAADASYSREPQHLCAVLTADCLPILLCHRAGISVGAIHAGWRGLLKGVIPATLAAMDCAPDQLLAWLGPAIGPHRFEVGEEVQVAFMAQDAATHACFRPAPKGRWLADIYGLARRQLQRQGLTAIYGETLCTFSDRERFFSYRRDSVTGRMATLIWMAE